MIDGKFVYWTTNGERREVPISVFLVPDGETLGPAHIHPQTDNRGNEVRLSSGTSALDHPLERVPRQTG